jgi:hypothetical protein
MTANVDRPSLIEQQPGKLKLFFGIMHFPNQSAIATRIG